MKARGKKQFIFVFALAGLLALFLLAAGLANLEFKGAETVPDHIGIGPGASFLQYMLTATLIEQILFIGGIITFFALIFALLNPKMRKRLLWGLVRLTIIFSLIAWAASRIKQSLPLPETPLEGLPAAGPGAPGTAVPSVPSAAPPWMAFVASLAFILILFIVVWWVWQRAQKSRTPLNKLTKIARATLRKLDTDLEWEDAVIRCYVDMCAAVSEQRGLRRGEGMTPGEFTLRLESAGLPSKPVRRLTRLFEAVRYGTHRSSLTEADEAVHCLQDILAECEAA